MPADLAAGVQSVHSMTHEHGVLKHRCYTEAGAATVNGTSPARWSQRIMGR